MPYMIQFVKNSSDKLEELDERTKVTKPTEVEGTPGMDAAMDPGMAGGVQPMLQLAPTAFNDPNGGYMQQNQYGMGQNMNSMNMQQMNQPNMGGGMPMNNGMNGGYQY